MRRELAGKALIQCPFIRDSNKNDIDLCACPVLLPWGNLVGAWGKDRAYYIMDRDNLGKFTPGHNAIVQSAAGMTSSQHIGIDPASWTGHIHCAPVMFDDPVRGPLSYVWGSWTGHIHCAPVMFDEPVRGPLSYFWGENDRLRGYRFDTSGKKFETPLALVPGVGEPKTRL
jgi:hypothetical protein